MADDIRTFAGAARLARPNADTDCSTLPWHPHPRFAGVPLRHLVTAADTGGALGAGFCDQAHMTRCFSRVAGLTPASHARAHRVGSG